MSKPFFTPGTWIYAKNFDAIIVKKKHRLVPVADFGKVGRLEQDANAKVMASSKELYYALKDCLKVIDSLMPGVKHLAIQNYAILNDAPLAARKAIAKVES